MAGGLNNMGNLRRAVVGFRGHDPHDKPKITDFLTCLVNHFSPNELSTTVSCEINDDMLVLYPSNSKETVTAGGLQKSEESTTHHENVTLCHSPECPLWKLQENSTSLPINAANKRINVGVAILLESLDSRVLMTQRSDNMRTFPRAWVPPGGNLEVGESPLEGALREVEEEAGLKLDSSNCFTRLLCLWESVYPPFLPIGAPVAHHAVLYFLAKSKENWETLQEKIQLDPEEVKACTWLTRDNIRSLYAGPSARGEKIKQFILGENGKLQPADLELHKMFFTDMWKGNGKYIYTGSQLALTKWLESEHEVIDGNIPSKI